MDSYSKKVFIKNSDSLSYSFYLVAKNTIMFDFFNDKSEYIKSLCVADSNIVDYDVDIDDKDIIHLLCLTKEGNLTYYIYKDERWSNHILTNLDVKSNKYRNLILKVVRNEVHIFYSVSNLLNQNLWTIKHVASEKRKWNKNNIISITPGKSSDPFYISFDRTGGIHLIYADIDNGKQHIYYTSYNTFLQRWNKAPERISDSNTDNSSPFIFIDNTNSIHVTWSSKINNTTHLIYKQMSVLSNSKHSWKRYKLPQIRSNCTDPIIIQDNGMLKLLYNQNNLLKCHYSHNHGYTWNTEESPTNIEFNNLDLVRFSSNYPYDKFRIKIDYIYGTVQNNVQLYYCDSYKNSSNLTSNRTSSSSYYDLKEKNDTGTLSKNNEQDEKFAKYNIQQGSQLDASQQNTNKFTEESKFNTPTAKEEPEKDSVNYNTEPLKTSNKDKPEDYDVSTPNLIEEIKNDDIKEFILTTKNSLESLFSNTSILHEHENEIENIIFINVKDLDKKILNNIEFTDEIKENLSTLENKIDTYKTQNEGIGELLSSIGELYDHNITQIEDIQYKILQIHNLIENTAAPNFLEKILSIFKK